MRRDFVAVYRRGVVGAGQQQPNIAATRRESHAQRRVSRIVTSNTTLQLHLRLLKFVFKVFQTVTQYCCWR